MPKINRNKAVKRRMSLDSTYNKTMERWESEYLGRDGFANHKTDWTNAQLDELLEAYLVLDLPFVANRYRASLLKTCKRTLGAVKVGLWKLAGRYRERQHFANYTPMKRTRRYGDWTVREMALVALSTNESGIARGAHVPEWVAKIVGRPVKDVEKMFQDTCEKRKHGFKQPVMTDERVARVVHLAMIPFLCQIETAIKAALRQLSEQGEDV